jgi:hypothetical protein
LIMKQSGLDGIREFYQRGFGITVQIVDLRREWAELSPDGTQIRARHSLEGDPRGYSLVDLGVESDLEPIARDGARFSVADYHSAITQLHHKRGKHEYLISNTVLDADCVINMPKLKFHVKSGITAALKNFIGINGAKDFLAHHRTGSVGRGGDEYPSGSLFNFLFSKGRKILNERAPHSIWKVARTGGLAARRMLARRPTSLNTGDINRVLVSDGGWYGNDTIWRTVYDVNKIFFLFNRQTQQLSRAHKRNYFCLVDAIVSGEANGPLTPEPKHSGCLIAGTDPVEIDFTCAKLMGLDWQRIPLLREHKRLGEISSFNGDFDDKSWVTNSERIESILRDPNSPGFRFLPADGWLNHVEISPLQK